MSFDETLNERIRVGRYQIIATSILVLIDMNDGVQLVLMSFVNPILQVEWHLTSQEIAFLTSLFYLGTTLGSCSTGSIADRYGRKLTIQISSLMLFFVSIAFFFVNSVSQMAFVRVLYGFTYGFSLPLTTSMLSEIIPIQYRGKGLVFLNFFVSLGKLIGCFLAMICLDSFSSGNWRLMMVLSSFPSLIVFFASSAFLMESPRFLLANQQYEESILVINKMIEINSNADATIDKSPLTREEASSIIETAKSMHGHIPQASFKALFKGELFGITLRMWVVWFMENAMYFGQLVIIPFILGKSNKSFGSYIITILGEMPSCFVSMYIVDHPLLGRKNSLTICFFISMVFHLVCFLYGNGSMLALMTSFARFFMKLCYAMLYPFTTELYPTAVRTVGFGMSSGVGRMGATLVPYLLFAMIEGNPQLPFLLFAITSSIAMIASHSLPYDTRGRQLDCIETHKEFELKLLEKETHSQSHQKL